MPGIAGHASLLGIFKIFAKKLLWFFHESDASIFLTTHVLHTFHYWAKWMRIYSCNFQLLFIRGLFKHDKRSRKCSKRWSKHVFQWEQWHNRRTAQSCGRCLGGALEETPFERHLQPFGTLTKHWHRCFRARCICQECKTVKVQLHHSSTANSHVVCFTSILHTIF